MNTAELLALKRRLEQLSPADQLRIAAGCIDEGKYEIAETLINRIADELAAVRLLRGSGTP